MTAKEFLNHARKLNIEVKQLQDAKQEAFASACGTSIDYSAERVQSSSGNSSERKLITYSDFSVMLDERIAELEAYRAEVLAKIELLENATYRTLLIARYINCKTWEQIAEEMGYSDKWTRCGLHSRALSALENIMR
ncbi:MAG: hypothetical protein E7397_04515 [Ruminococcaceae bacterium]|nr:hypothetical protein [Oscillospiraceae bacterium]